MTWNYSHKTALVTGASSGIGEVFAHELAKKGCNLILVARSQEKLKQIALKLQNTYSINAIALPIDLTASNATEKIAEGLTTLGLSVDILINNAGFGTLGSFDKIPQSRVNQEIQLNLVALTELTHKFIGPMIERKKGIIINVASMTAFQPVPYMAVYGATKAYVLSFTEAIWAEYRDSGVQILALCPGETKSSFHAASGSDSLKGKRMEPIEVVDAAFKALEKDRSMMIAGLNNYVMAQVIRLLPRSTVLKFAKRIFQPALGNK
ncbi:SDR family NAD(P)-dependent oxidoreductase [Paenibacillus agricola]|uniref:SDR family oxidoreductase n=1 Tax=Paenibacillus agricola TaxID=2716264 RepID=A0ABX0JDC6_9BACL|nr:SDR family oxidoreductase [Paenibacillus agricola]NHN34439.1 SDR family oxidoreductase [Paenibacillus agricola]